MTKKLGTVFYLNEKASERYKKMFSKPKQINKPMKEKEIQQIILKTMLSDLQGEKDKIEKVGNKYKLNNYSRLILLKLITSRIDEILKVLDKNIEL